ncbi:hypothetical protein NL676_004772 [Syzygium grande]|nr:hypothetical protein NL676_004772 [Syzygium grande]
MTVLSESLRPPGPSVVKAVSHLDFIIYGESLPPPPLQKPTAARPHISSPIVVRIFGRTSVPWVNGKRTSSLPLVQVKPRKLPIISRSIRAHYPEVNEVFASPSLVSAKTWYLNSRAAEMEVQMIGGANPNPMNGHGNHHHVVTVATDAARDWSSVVHRRLSQRPTRLKHSAGSYSCCIFKVPGTLLELNPKAYKPRIVSIGPYHHGKEYVHMIEEHKPRFFSALLARTRSFGVDYNDYFNALASKEEEIRDCYSEPLNFGSSELIEMMVLDGCFIIEMFRVIESIVTPEPDDPIFNMLWTFTSFMRDFLHLENQVPFFVLQTLYDMSKCPADPQCSLVEVALRFFNYGVQRPPDVLMKYYGVSDVKHLLHLIQMSLINLPPESPREFDDEYLQLAKGLQGLPAIARVQRAFPARAASRRGFTASCLCVVAAAQPPRKGWLALAQPTLVDDRHSTPI